MKILWVKCDFLHPTNKGGKIRTLEMLRRLHARHEIHYAAFEDSSEPEAVPRSQEYCTRAYPVRLRVPARGSLSFAGQAIRNVFSPLPLSIERYSSTNMRGCLQQLIRQERFDSVVCDFLSAAPLLPEIESCVLFQHNVETIIWRRYADTARGAVARCYFRVQAERMFRYEREICRRVKGIVAVSPNDAKTMAELFAIPIPPAISTGVDIDYFTPAARAPVAKQTDLIFIGSMDWMPNIDGVEWFILEVLPQIRKRRRGCSFTVAGRKPSSAIVALAAKDSGIVVTGSVPDIRPFLWGAAVSIVPLRVGGGTRLKIYESMAACVPVISTTVGAEGLDVHPGTDIRIADTAEDFANQCLDLLKDGTERNRIAERAWEMVSQRFAWECIARQFEEILASVRPRA